MECHNQKTKDRKCQADKRLREKMSGKSTFILLKSPLYMGKMRFSQIKKNFWNFITTNPTKE